LKVLDGHNILRLPFGLFNESKVSEKYAS
jgi:hypothetical protein